LKQNVLYAADFHNNKIDMFDGGFHSLGSFTDPSVPAQYPGHTAWQVEDLNGQLWVTYASHKPGPYGGAVDIFDTDGHLLTPNHFTANAPGGPLANPWGIVQAPASFGAFGNDILIGNVEGGDIDAFDPTTGAFLGQLHHPDGTPISIPGLWDLTFGGDSPDNGLSQQLYFDAGPNAPNPAGNGLFGRIIAAGSQGNGQGASTDGAAVPAAKSAIIGLAPLPSATATGPQATAYGWLIDVAPTSSGALTTLVHQGKSHKADWATGLGS
jgi:uncharacterized protein (TIGR03118 family)